MFHNGATFNREFEIASEFNNYFASVFNDKVISPLPDNTSLSNVCLNDLDLSLETITVLLKNCQDSSNTGADLVPSFVLFNCAEALSPVILDLFYWILNWKHRPEQWKHSLITPLFKNGAHNDITNYRAISILPFLSLILEKIIFDFIYPKIRHLIKREQHGFMKSRSTVSHMITYLDLVYSSRDNNIPALSIYFDVRKAFDTVPHHLLLSKLEKFGFDLGFLHLFNSHLLNRYQSVRINKSVSFLLPVTSGVPQGSVLGPLPFVLFISDIADDISNSHFYLFADDLKIFTSADESLVQNDMDSLQRWCSLNCLEFHLLKCKALNFGGFDENLHLMLGFHCLPYVDKIEDLGFIVTKNLSWKEHINFKLLKSSRVLQFLKRNIPHVKSVNRNKLLLKSLLLPILLYGAPVWCPSVVDLKRMELFQYKAIRWIKACPFYVSGLSQLDLLPISYLLIRDDIILLWKLYNNQIDVDSNLATMSLPTRSSTNNLFVVPKTLKFSSDHNFFVRAPRAANELIRQQIISFKMHLDIFKSALNKFLTFKSKSTFNIDHSCSYFVKCFCKTRRP